MFCIIITTYLETIGLLEVRYQIQFCLSVQLVYVYGCFTTKIWNNFDIAASIFGLFYLGFLPSYWIKLRGFDSVILVQIKVYFHLKICQILQVLYLTLTSCFLIVASDMGSFFIGRSFGKSCPFLQFLRAKLLKV